MGRLMVVIRLGSGALLVHSPAELTEALRSDLLELGEVGFVVPASSLHGHLYMEQYRDAYPGAKLFAAPGLQRKRTDLSFDGELSSTPEPGWSQDLDQAVFSGHSRLTEIEFFHAKTRTLITGDLCFNIGADWPSSTRLLAWGPSMKRRLGPTTAFRQGIGDHEAARRSLHRILDWDFDRIVPGHGEIVDTNGKSAFTDGFAWLLA
jgi:hypothetical protein